ncbi:MAG: transglutaminase family protein [bacterium]|nr:transglutaminase family protein [bacterium]
MKYRVVHRTEYDYAGPVDQCHNEARLLLRDSAHQHCEATQLDIEPQPKVYRERRDFFGNRVTYFAIQERHSRLRVSATSEVEVTADRNIDLSRSRRWEQARPHGADWGLQDGGAACLFALDSPLVPLSAPARQYAEISCPPGRPLLEVAHDLMARIHRDYTYVPGFTAVTTPLAEVMEHRKGVCQDFAHVAIACLRSMGLPARYVSGYLETLPPPGQRKLVGADASHAWFAVFDPDLGWVEFDPTNDRMAGEQHLTVAWGRDFADVSPLKGVLYGSGKHRLKVSVDVARVE